MGLEKDALLIVFQVRGACGVNTTSGLCSPFVLMPVCGLQCEGVVAASARELTQVPAPPQLAFRKLNDCMGARCSSSAPLLSSPD